MGLLSRLINGVGGTVARTSMVAPAAYTYIPNDSVEYDYVLGAEYREYAVRVVVDFIADQLASLPLKVYKPVEGGGAKEVESPLSALLHKPSRLPSMTRFNFFRRVIIDMLMYDRWLCIVETDSRGDWQLRHIPADRYSVDINGFNEITGVNISNELGQTVHVNLPDERVMLHVGYIDSLGAGSPVTSVLRPLLDEARAMSEYRRNLAKNGVQVPAYVYRPKDMPWQNQADYDNFVQALRAYTNGGNLAGHMPILSDGMELRALDNVFKPVDVNDLEARDKVNIAVANAFHISPENLGFRTGTNSNIEAYKEKLWNVELLPYVAAFEQALNFTLPDALGEPDCFIRANLDAKLRGTLSEQYKTLSTATGRAVMTTNEARALLNLPPVEDGDELVTPLNVLVGGQPNPQDGGVTQHVQDNTSVNGKE